MRVAGRTVEVLPYTSATEHLGRLLTTDALHETEITGRLKKGWSKFFSFKLFNAIITLAVLYGSATRTMNANMTRQLRTTQKRMLRWMLGGFW